MSITPQKLPKRTRVLIKDLLFQEKHQLTDTQVDIMSYIFNALTWAMTIQGFMVLTSKKFMDDLPQIGQKTLNAALLELVNKGLITREMVTVSSWGNARVRGIKINSDGMEYNSSLYTPSHQGILNAYQARIDGLEAEKKIWEAKENAFEEQLKKALESEALSPKNGDLNEKEREEEQDINEAETVDSKSANLPEPEAVKPPTESLDEFVKRVRNQFILTSEPICNNVDGWQKETTFYLNSYGKLSLNTKNRDFMQIKSPIEIKSFWEWLKEHPERIGVIVDFKSIDEQITQLNQKYKDTKIKINGKEKWIEQLVPMGKGISIKIRNAEGNVAIIANVSQQPIVYEQEQLEAFIGRICTDRNK